MTYNHGKEERKWRIWKEAEEKTMRDCGFDEDTIEQIRTYDREVFNSDRWFYQRVQETDTYLDTAAEKEWQAEVWSVSKLLDEIENMELYREELTEQLRIDVEKQDDKTANISAFVEKAKKFTAIKELTHAIVHEFIDYVMVSSKQVINGKTVYPIDIYYNGVGILNVSTAEELEEMFEERRKQKRSKEQKMA